MALLSFVGLGYLIRRAGKAAPDAESPLLGELPWHALSVGEQQRLSMARLLWHRPAVAAVDECSSAVDERMEAKFYRRCAADNIAIVSIGHRRSLRRHHEALLRLDGAGGWTLSACESFRPAA